MKRKRAYNPTVVDKDPTLPVLKHSQDVLTKLSRHDVLVLVAETGSGKTTQIPQIILDSNKLSSIVVTQPRRVAAISVATRVAEERCVHLGELVGYAVRFEDKSKKGVTQIRFVTDGVMLREVLSVGAVGLKRRYSHIIIDEVHERSVNTDILLGVVRQMVSENSGTSPNEKGISGTKPERFAKLMRSQLPFKVIIMSASTDEQKLLKFFQRVANLSVGFLRIPGRKHEVRVMYAIQSIGDYILGAVQTAYQALSKEEAGDVLVFLPGQEDIMSAIAMMREKGKSGFPKEKFAMLSFLPLYASLPPEEQMRTLEPVPQHLRAGRRKVIFATNIAETSITIPGVTIVIDSGMVKVRDMRAEDGFPGDRLQVQRISRAQALQRRGRAGRTGPGTLFCLYTEEEFNNLEEYPKPEILRTEPTQTLLQIITLSVQPNRLGRNVASNGNKGIDAVNRDRQDETPTLSFMNFPLIDKLSEKVSERGLETLCLLGALDNSMTLTRAGELMGRIPVSPMLSRTLLEALRVGCIDPVLSLAAILSVEGSIFLLPAKQLDRAKAAHRRFIEASGDHLSQVCVLNDFMLFESVQRRQEFCQDHFLNYTTLASAMTIRSQLDSIMQHSDMLSWALMNPLPSDLTIELQETDMDQLVRRCLVAGFFRNVAKKRPQDNKYTTIGREMLEVIEETTLEIHPSSVLRTFKRKSAPELLLFNELVLTSKPYLRTVVTIEKKWLMQHCTYYKQAHLH